MPQRVTKPDRFTYGDYRRWPEDERWELIDGEVYDMCPAPARVQQQMKRAWQQPGPLLSRRAAQPASPRCCQHGIWIPPGSQSAG